MSLSFVASAVQTATADGGFEEKEINKEQVESVNKRNAHKPLFEQLRQNQEEEQAKQEEIQREMMRGTRALDVDDVAHLEALAKQRMEREMLIQQKTQEELLLFRAARVERQQVELGDKDDENSEGGGLRVAKPLTAARPPPPPTTTKSTPAIPKLVVKKRKRKIELESGNTGNGDVAKKMAGKDKNEDLVALGMKPLGGLLSGYGSSDEESND